MARGDGGAGGSSGQAPSLRRTLRAAFTERLAYKGAALFFALVLWLIVKAEEPSEELVPVRLEAELDSTRVLTNPRPAIRALVAGRARDLIKLYDTPPVVRRVVGPEAPDTIAFEIRPADVYLPPGVDAIVRDVQPRTLMLFFDVSLTRRVPVTNELALAVDTSVHGVREMRLIPDSVEVVGPRTVVRAIESVPTVSDTVAVRDSGQFQIPLDATRLGANVRVRPTHVRLSVLFRETVPPEEAGSEDTAQRRAAPVSLARPR